MSVACTRGCTSACPTPDTLVVFVCCVVCVFPAPAWGCQGLALLRHRNPWPFSRPWELLANALKPTTLGYG